MEVKKSLWVVASFVALVGCRQELAEITYLLDDVEPLVIERGFLPAQSIIEGGLVSSDTRAVGACVQAPTTWGAPIVEVNGTSDGGMPFSDIPAEDATKSDAAQALLPRAQHIWYCYKLAEKAYREADRGQVTWQFAAGSEHAQVLSTVSGDDSLVNVVVHDVVRAAKAKPGMWQSLPVTLSGDTPASVEAVESWTLAGDFQGKALFNRGIGDELLLVDADGRVAVKMLPFDAYLFNAYTQAVVASPERLIGFEETAPNELTAQVSTDGVIWDAGGTVSLSGGGVPFVAYNAGLGRFVVTLTSGKQFYSADGVSWSEESIAEASGFAWEGKVYASLASGTEAVRGTNLAGESVLFVRAAGDSNYSEALPKPAAGSPSWFVDGVVAVGNRFFVETHDESGASGEEYTLLTSADAGASWQQVAQLDSRLRSTLLAAAKDDLIVVGFNSEIYLSKDGGLNFVAADFSSAMPTQEDFDAVSLERVFVESGTYFLELKFRDGRSEEHTSELQSRPHVVCRLL